MASKKLLPCLRGPSRWLWLSPGMCCLSLPAHRAAGVLSTGPWARGATPEMPGTEAPQLPTEHVGCAAQSAKGGRRVERAHRLRRPTGRWVFSWLLWGVIDTFKARSLLSLALSLGCVGWRGRPIGNVNGSEEKGGLEVSEVRTWGKGV